MAALSNVLRNASSVITSLDGHDYHLTVAEFVAQGNASTAQMLASFITTQETLDQLRWRGRRLYEVLRAQTQVAPNNDLDPIPIVEAIDVCSQAPTRLHVMHLTCAYCTSC